MKRSAVLAILITLPLLGTACSRARTSAQQAVNTAQQTGDIVSGAADLALKAKADLNLATSEARDAYNRAVADERDLANGPCLANPIAALPDWVVDIAHNPRTPADDESTNQCSVFREGRAQHFVELDPTGQLIRAE